MSGKRIFFVLISLSLALLSGGALVFFKAFRQPPVSTLAWGEFGYVPDFSLIDAAGRKVSRSDIKGPWLASFIFTRCGGVCPLLTGRMKKIQPLLPESLSLVSFSVDPADRPQDLERYMKTHRADWMHLTGTEGQVSRLCREGFKLPVSVGRSEIEAIAHSEKLVLVDATGMIRGYYDSSDASAMRELLRRARQLAVLRGPINPS